MTAKEPKVSVIIPAYNAQNFIETAIRSVLSQTHQNLECIVIDDCSTDSTWNIVTALAHADRRIKTYQNKQNVGIGANRSRGVSLATGDFICWVDSDDIAMPQRIEHQVSYLLTHPRVGVVGGYLEFFGESGPSSIREYAESDSDLRRSIFRYNPVAQPASMVRKVCYEDVGLFDEELTVSEDLEMLFRIGTKYEFANLQEVVLRYRIHAASLTASKLKKMELTTLSLRRRYGKHPAYRPTTTDYAYNAAQFVSIFIIPPRLKMKLFTLLRNKSK